MYRDVAKNINLAPVIAGGVYTRTDRLGDKHEAVMGGVVTRTNGRREGLLREHGKADLPVMSGTDTMLGWTLIATPALLDTPIVGDRSLSTEEELKLQVLELKNQLAEYEAANK